MINKVRDDLDYRCIILKLDVIYPKAAITSNSLWRSNLTLTGNVYRLV